MIANMPAASSSHSPNSLSASTPTTCIAESSPDCEYNFLKRKFDGDITPTDSIVNTNTIGNPTAEYQNTSCTTPVWKKCHMQESTDSITESNCFTTSVSNFKSNENLLIDAIQTENVQNEINVSTRATLTTNNNSAIINNTNNNNNNRGIGENKANSNTNNNNNNNNSNMTFNLIASNSSFINDLFAYDANLIVPVSASVVSHNTSTTDSQLPAFATPSNVCLNTNYDDGTNWQATDLLELDHRYNSGLQTEIAHLHPTVALKATEESTLNAAQQSQEVLHQPQHQQQPQSSPQSQFLVHEKQMSRSPVCNTNLIRYRQQQVLQQSGVQPLPQNPQSIPQITSTSDTKTDFEDKNLSWLLNFKFDEFPHLSPDLSGNNSVLHGGIQQGNNSSPASSHKSNSCSPQSSLSSSTPHSCVQQSLNDYTRSSKSSTKASKKFEELVMEVTAEVDGNDMVIAENVVVENSAHRAPKKPPFTYTELIEYALEDKGELTVSGIYQWISDRFPYYKSNDDRWKNSVRHNLSINPHFRKGLKAPQGAGHLWTISSGDSAENVLAWEHKKQRLDLFFKMESMNRERLQQHQQQMQQRQSCTSPHPDCQQLQQQQQQQPQQQCVYDEAATAAATITREMLNSSNSSEESCSQRCNKATNNNNPRLENTSLVHELPFNDLMSDEELRKTAGQILNGIHREVEVQSVNSIISTYHDVLLDNEDYLNPVHKDIAVHESGLRSTNATHLPTAAYTNSHNSSSQYYVTEIDPLELGIQMSHQVGAEEVLFSDEFNLNYFGYNGANDIVA